MELRKLPFRVWVGVMIFFTTALNYSLRTSFQITLLAMTYKNDTERDEPLPDYGPRYDWTSNQRAQLSSGYYYGYAIGTLAGGPTCEYFGPYWTCLVGTLCAGILAPVSAFVVDSDWVPLFITRILIGILSGVHYPSVQTIIGNWCPPNERGKFGACLMGNVFGILITQPLVGVLIGKIQDWSWGFYYIGIFAFLYAIAWACIISDAPEESWWCSTKEAQHIKQMQGDAVTIGKSKPPLKAMFKSVPYIALAVSHFGNMWGLYMYLTEIPKFMSDVLEFKIERVGVWASAPSFARLLFGVVFGGTADYLIKNGILAKVYVRKGFVIFSHILPGVLFFLFLFVGDDPVTDVTLLVLAMVFNGAIVATTLLNAQDLAPNYAGTQYGVITFFGAMSGFIIPLIVGKLTEEKNTLAEWSVLFEMSGVIFIISGLAFMIFGSLELQPWNAKQ